MRRAAMLSGVLALLVPAAAVIALHLSSVQQLLYRRAAAELETRTGLRLEAESFRLRPFGLHVELSRPTLAVDGAEPFFTADRLTVEVAPRAVSSASSR